MALSDKTKRILFSIVVPAVLAIALVVTAVWGAQKDALADDYKSATQAMYKRAFLDLADEFDALSNTLSKLVIVGSRTQYIKLLDDVWRSSGASVSLMSQIPASHIDTVELNQFVVRLGDYAHSLSSKILSGAMPTEEDANQLIALRDKCAELAQDISKRLEAGDIPVELLDNEGYFTSVADAGDSDESQDEEARQEFPTLIYDGPYSVSAEKAEPKGLTGDEIDSNQALQVAEQKTPKGAVIEFSGESNGNIPSFDFSGALEDDRFVEISITKRGGHVLWFMCQATSDEGGVPNDDTKDAYKDAAVEYLEEAGFLDMESTYAQYYGGAAVINFAAAQDGVILYSDLIKVWVDLKTKEVIGFDARNYLYSHVERDLNEPTLSEQEARGLISENIDVQSVKLALIPITPNTERLCYEFKGNFKEEVYIVYINADSGEEEQIFKVIDSDQGSLVI